MMNRLVMLALGSAALALTAGCRDQSDGSPEAEPAVAAEEIVESVTPEDQLDGPAVALTVAGVVRLPDGASWPVGADLRVTISDTSRADAPALMLAETVLQPAGEEPAHYTIEVSEHEIDERFSYSVRATVRDPATDALLLTSDTHYPVITRGAGFGADIQLVAVPAEPQQ